MIETSKKKRLINFIVDLIIFAIIIEITGQIEELVTSKEPVKILRLLLVLGGYRIPMEYFLGKTIGKYVTKTKVVNREGNRISFKEALIRSICRWMIPFEFLSLGLGADAKAWHDVISKTYVIDDNKA